MSTTIERILHELESRGRGPSTPLYIVSEEILKENIDAMNRAFFSRFDRFVLGYSYKTNYAKDVLRMVHQEGGYAEVVSPMELAHARTFVDDSRIIYNGVIRDVEGKVELAAHGGIVNVENMTELRDMDAHAARMGLDIQVGIRVNLRLSGAEFSRFGIEVNTNTLEELSSLKHIEITGIHCHITKSRALSFWREKAEKMAQIAKRLGARYIDFGGNMYGPMNPALAAQFHSYIPSFQDYADCLYDELSQLFSDEDMPTVIVEPGTPIISNAQSYLTTVTDIKTVAGKTVCTLDGKSLDVTMIGDSGKQFPFYVISSGEGHVEDAAMYGCTCLEPDKFADGYSGPLSVGDYVLFDNIGSYSNTLAPRFIQGVPAMARFSRNGKLRFTKLMDSSSTVFGEYL